MVRTSERGAACVSVESLRERLFFIPTYTMIINYKQEDGGKCVAVVLPNYGNYIDLLDLKTAIITGIKAIAPGDYCCFHEEAYTLAELLEAMELTEEQAKTLKI